MGLLVDTVGEEALKVPADQVGHRSRSGELFALVVGIQFLGKLGHMLLRAIGVLRMVERSAL